MLSVEHGNCLCVHVFCFAVANSWSGLVLGDSFQVRGREYLSDKKKTASEESMYEVVQVEAYRTDRRMLNVAKLLEITSETV